MPGRAADVDAAPMAASEGGGGGGSGGYTPAPQGHTTTNVQEQGVDEADTVALTLTRVRLGADEVDAVGVLAAGASIYGSLDSIFVSMPY